MTLVAAYRAARHEEDVARLRRALVLHAMVASGMTQRQIAEELGVSQPAVSQQLKAARDLAAADPQVLVEAAGPVLKDLAAARGYSRLAVFGSVARGQSDSTSDVDLLVQAPAGTSTSSNGAVSSPRWTTTSAVRPWSCDASSQAPRSRILTTALNCWLTAG